MYDWTVSRLPWLAEPLKTLGRVLHRQKPRSILYILVVVLKGYSRILGRCPVVGVLDIR
jgi:hypothetical protein